MRKVLIIAGLLYAAGCCAEVLTFDFKGDASLYSLLDNQPSGSVTNGGLIVTLTASDGTLNRTSSGFGVNGAGTDDTDGLNAGQFIDVAFSMDVIFTNLVVSSWGGSDTGEVQLGPAFLSQGSIDGSDPTPYGFAVDIDAGETIRILAVTDSGETNGFSVDGFSTVIPEPAIAGMMGLGGCVMMLMRKRRR